jgi:hypothetical protein
MQDYEIRRGHFSEIEGEKLGQLMEGIFGNGKKLSDYSYETSFGAIARLTATLKDKKVLTVDPVMNTKVDANTAAETVRKYNMFLEKATGFTSKERMKRIQKKAKEGKL